jgi:hypothetical protein
MLANLFRGFRFGVEQKVIGPAEYIDVGQDAPLGRKKERVAALAGLQLLHVIRGHCMKEPRAVLAGYAETAT